MFDTDGDNAINSKELLNIIRSLGIVTNEANDEFQELINQIDKDGNSKATV